MKMASVRPSKQLQQWTIATKQTAAAIWFLTTANSPQGTTMHSFIHSVEQHASTASQGGFSGINARKRDRDDVWGRPLFQLLAAGLPLVLVAYAPRRSKSIPHATLPTMSSSLDCRLC